MNERVTTAALALGALALAATAVPVNAQEGDKSVDDKAVEILRSTTDYLGGLEKFSVFVLNLREDVLDSGYRVDTESSGYTTVVRPDKLRGVRHAGPVDELIVYDGETATLYNDVEQTFSTVAVPPTIEEMFLFVNDYVEIYPVSDLIWRDAFPYMMEGVDHAEVVGTEVIGGVSCTHLLFGRPDVGIQIWVPEEGPPLPAKYIVTDYGTPEMLSIVTFISEWNLNPDVSEDTFTFVPPDGATEVPFPMPDSSD